MTDTPERVTQGQVNILLERLQQLHQRIHVIQQEIAPIESNLARVYKEYQAAIGHLQREHYQLQTKIALLQEIFDGSNQDQGSTTHSQEAEGTIDLTSVQSQSHNNDDIAKDMLHEHLYMVLDTEDDELLAHLQALCSDPTTKLVDVLEKIPWGAVWINRTTPMETLVQQYQRLITWEQALQAHLHLFERIRGRSQLDRRYGLWLQYQKGQQEWNQFLQGVTARMQEYNAELKLELQHLSDCQAKMRYEHE